MLASHNLLLLGVEYSIFSTFDFESKDTLRVPSSKNTLAQLVIGRIGLPSPNPVYPKSPVYVTFIKVKSWGSIKFSRAKTASFNICLKSENLIKKLTDPFMKKNIVKVNTVSRKNPGFVLKTLS